MALFLLALETNQVASAYSSCATPNSLLVSASSSPRMGRCAPVCRRTTGKWPSTLVGSLISLTYRV